MGDRCWLSITYRKADESLFAEQLGENWYEEMSDEGDSWREVFVSEANYGFYGEREALAKAGVCFFGFHTAGGDYPAAVFAAFNGEDADVSGFDGRPHVRLTKEGDPEIEDLARARKYLRICEAAEQFMSVNTEPVP